MLPLQRKDGNGKVRPAGNGVPTWALVLMTLLAGGLMVSSYYLKATQTQLALLKADGSSSSTELHQTVEKKSAEVEALKEEKNKLKDELNKVKKSADTLTELEKSEKGDLEAKQNQIDKLKAEIAQLKDKASGLDKDKMTAKERHEMLAADIAKIQSVLRTHVIPLVEQEGAAGTGAGALAPAPAAVAVVKEGKKRGRKEGPTEDMILADNAEADAWEEPKKGDKGDKKGSKAADAESDAVAPEDTGKASGKKGGKEAKAGGGKGGKAGDSKGGKDADSKGAKDAEGLI